MFPDGKSPPVPEVTIYKDCHPLSRKDDVGRSMQRPTISLKAETDAPELPLNQPLQRAILEPHAFHSVGPLGWRHVIRHLFFPKSF